MEKNISRFIRTKSTTPTNEIKIRHVTQVYADLNLTKKMKIPMRLCAYISNMEQVNISFSSVTESK